MSVHPQLQAAPRAVFPYQWMLPFGQFMICALLLLAVKRKHCLAFWLASAASSGWFHQL